MLEAARWITLGLAIFVVGLAVGYMLGEMFGVGTRVWIYHLNTQGGYIPSWRL